MVLGSYKSSGTKRALKKMTVIATVIGGAEFLVIEGKGIQWRNVTGGYLQDVSINGVAWECKWSEAPWHPVDSDIYKLDIDTVTDLKVLGRVEPSKRYRSPNTTCYYLSNKDKRPTTFNIQLKYYGKPEEAPAKDKEEP